MTTRISSAGPDNGVVRTPTAARVTPPPARPFRAVMDAGTSAVVASAESAARRLPGGPILAAAFRSTPVTVSSPGMAVSPSDLDGATGGAVGVGVAESPGLVTGVEPEGNAGVDATLAPNGDRTLQYLELQERISAESNAYMALSNVLKARHDTIKNAIGNIR